MGDQPWPPPVAGPPGGAAGRRNARLRSAALLFLVALASGGLTFGLLHEEGFVAVSGQRAVAQVKRCDTGRHPSCFAVVRTPTGETLDTDAEMANSSASEGDEVRVRYRAGKAVRDSPSGRLGPLLLVTLFAVVSVVGLVAAVASAAGRTVRTRRRPPRHRTEP